MSTHQPSDLFASFQYHDAPAGIAFLERAFGFERHAVYEREDGTIMHAELRAGRGFVMTSSLAADSQYAFVTPRDTGGHSTGSVYLGAPEVDTLFARAVAAGAEVVDPLQDTDYGSRDFGVRDPEGFLWHCGTYRPTSDGGDPFALEGSDVYAGMRYDDARGAIAWLGKAFGFEEQLVVPGKGDAIAHAQLRFGSSVLMLGSGSDDARRMTTPHELGGAYTHLISGYVPDPDAHAARARAAGAEILEEPEDRPYGARVYVARDPEGYVWCFGDYRPGSK